jgi:tRNA modification GTPase
VLEPIAACITAWGHAAVAVVRVSGDGAGRCAERVCGTLPPPWGVRKARLRDASGVFDEGLVSWFPGPRSYTGEDVVEISCHGNPLLVERLLAALGARTARPGEFTRRAFLNGRVDLTRAEAVLATIAATSPAGLATARSAMEGTVAAEAARLRLAVVDLAAELEAILDYPGEDLLLPDDAELRARLLAVASAAEAVAASWQAGRVAVEGARVVLVGPANAGKSSLFNALLGRPRSIVSASPGTTRDVVEATLQTDQARVVLVDTAGLRDAADEVEAEGITRAGEAAADADLLVACVPGHLPWRPPATALIAGTFADRGAPPPGALAVSSATGEGVGELRAEILRRLRGEEGGARVLLASKRQHDLFVQVAGHARASALALAEAGPAAAVERLYAAVECLDDVGGGDAREAVLDRLFSRFCVGK